MAKWERCTVEDSDEIARVIFERSSDYEKEGGPRALMIGPGSIALSIEADDPIYLERELREDVIWFTVERAKDLTPLVVFAKHVWCRSERRKETLLAGADILKIEGLDSVKIVIPRGSPNAEEAARIVDPILTSTKGGAEAEVLNAAVAFDLIAADIAKDPPKEEPPIGIDPAGAAKR